MKVSRHPSAARGRQRGAISLLTALLLTLVLTTVALTLDTGRLMLEKRRLQQRADLAALAAAQQVCDGAASAADAEGVVWDNLEANGFLRADSANRAQMTFGTVQSPAANSGAPLRTFIADNNGRAVRVQLTRRVPAALFAGGLVGGQATLHAQATAQRNLIGTLSAGSKLVNLSVSDAALLNPILGKMLGIPLTITAVGYNGLVQANLQLQRLRDAMIDAGVVPTGASLQDVANATPAIGTLLSVMASAAGNGSAAAQTLLNIKAALSGGAAGKPVALGSILAIDPGATAEQGLNSSINSLALLMASAMANSAGQMLNIGLNVSTAGLNSLLGAPLTTTLSLAVVQPPVIAVGRFGVDADGKPYTLAKTSQLDLRLGLTLKLSDSGGLLGGLLDAVLGLLEKLLGLSKVLDVTGDIGIKVSAAGGSAWMDHVITCPSRADSRFSFALAGQPEAATVRIGANSNPELPGNLTIKTLGLTLAANLGADIALGNPAPTLMNYDVDLSQPGALPTHPQSAATNLAAALNSLGNANTLVSNIVLRAGGLSVDVPLGIITTAVVQLLTPVLTQIAADVLQPLLDLLGVNVGTLEVSLLGVETGHGALLL